MKLRSIAYCRMAAGALLVLSVACSQERQAPEEAVEDARIRVAVGFAPMDVTTRATQTVTAQAFTGREPREDNPFHPMVWFTSTEGDYSTSDDAHHNYVNFTSGTLTFPDTDIEYSTADKNALTYCIGLYPTNAMFPGLWGVEDTSGWDSSEQPEGTLLYADISGQQDLMLAKEISGSINSKFNSTDADKILQFHHLLTWLKVRVTVSEQGAGAAWGDVKLVTIKSQERVRVDLGDDGGTIFDKKASGDVTVYAFAPDPDDPVNPQPYKQLEPEIPENPQIGSVLVVPAASYELTYQTVAMTDPATITVQLHNLDGTLVTTADEASNKVFVINLSFYQRNKVEATCTLEPMTDQTELLYGVDGRVFTLSSISGPFTYSGLPQTPSVSVTDPGGLTQGTDYDLFYSANINAGTASVAALGKGTYAGYAGSASFTIAKAAGYGSISYAETDVAKTYGDASFTNPLTNSLMGAGTVSYTLSYASSDETTATVNAASGAVTILKPGSSTITANVGDGANHTYADPPSASYTLTVNKAAGSMAFAASEIAKTYGDLPFSNALTVVGDGSIAYTSSDDDVATVDPSSGQVTIAGAGSATITATASDVVYYTYSPNTATYEVEVGKAVGTISYAVTGITKERESANFTNPLDKLGDGTVTYASTNTNIATVDAMTGEVALAGGLGSTTIRATVADGSNYTYPVTMASYTLTVVEP